jgi:aminoglycoside phosphotransferase (APT) family kinase protein
VLVAKVPRLIENGWMLKTEYDHLVELWNCIGPEAANYVPKPHAMTDLQERPVLVLSYVAGESLTRLSPRSFWRDKDKVSALSIEAARTLRRLNRLTESPIMSGQALDSDFHEKAQKFQELFPLSREEDRTLSDLVKMIERNAAAAQQKVITQGDFWHGNMIRDQKAGTLMFVDWQFARWSVDVSLDVYFFLLAGALSATGNGPVEKRAKEAFALLQEWRADVIPEYLKTYGAPEQYALLPQKYGMLLCCVEKAIRPALEFGYSHPDDLMWRHLFAELLDWQDSQ